MITKDQRQRITEAMARAATALGEQCRSGTYITAICDSNAILVTSQIPANLQQTEALRLKSTTVAQQVGAIATRFYRVDGGKLDLVDAWWHPQWSALPAPSWLRKSAAEQKAEADELQLRWMVHGR